MKFEARSVMLTLWAHRHSLIWFHTGFYLLSILCDFVIFLNSRSLQLYLDDDSKKEKEGQPNGVELAPKPALTDK